MGKSLNQLLWNSIDFSDVSTDKETIYSEQGYETMKAVDQTQTSDSEEEDTTRTHHDVEFDIESGEEEERPTQVRTQRPWGRAM